jgi:hypothetical protein
MTTLYPAIMAKPARGEATGGSMMMTLSGWVWAFVKVTAHLSEIYSTKIVLQPSRISRTSPTVRQTLGGFTQLTETTYEDARSKELSRRGDKHNDDDGGNDEYQW